MTQPTVQFWFEFGSTYSYPSVCRIEQVATQAGITIEWKPFLLGPLFKELGWNDSPFNIYPVKGRYMWRDLERLCQQYDLPFQKPTQFPRNGLHAARIALIAAAEGWCPAFARAVFHSNFVEDRDIADTEVLGQILEALGQNSQQIFERAQAPENKSLLRQQTEEAARLGIFGAPSFIANGELFWGNDRLEQAVEWVKRTSRKQP